MFNEFVLWRSYHSGLLNQLGNIYVRSLVKTRCSISFPPVPKISSTKNWLPSMGSSVFPNATSISVCSRKSEWTSFLYCVVVPWCFVPSFSKFASRGCVECNKVPTSVSSCGNDATTTQCFVQNVPPSTTGHHTTTEIVCNFILDDLACTAMESGTNIANNGEETSTNHDSFTIVQSKTNKSK